MRITKTYTPEFKLDAIRHARENKNTNATARNSASPRASSATGFASNKPVVQPPSPAKARKV